MHERCQLVYIDQFYETYKFLVPICTNEFTSIQVRNQSSFYRFKILPEMPETPSSSYRRLIINSFDAIHEVVIKWCDFHDHSSPPGTSDIFSRFLGQILPPSFEGGCRCYSPILRFPVIIILWSGLRRLLRKGKNVCL